MDLSQPMNRPIGYKAAMSKSLLLTSILLPGLWLVHRTQWKCSMEDFLTFLLDHCCIFWASPEYTWAINLRHKNDGGKRRGCHNNGHLGRVPNNFPDALHCEHFPCRMLMTDSAVSSYMRVSLLFLFLLLARKSLSSIIIEMNGKLQRV